MAPVMVLSRSVWKGWLRFFASDRAMLRMCMVLLSLSPCLQAQIPGEPKINSKITTTEQIIAHVVEGDEVRFSLSSAPLKLALQVLDSDSGRWQTLVPVQRPSAKLSRIQIPNGYQDSGLRVVATYRAPNLGRIQIPNAIDPADGSVIFSSIRGAKYYSIEVRADSKAAWSRLSTLDASGHPIRHRVPVSDSIAPGSEIRVVAVRGLTPAVPSHLTSSLPRAMRVGPLQWVAAQQIASAPIQTASLMSSEARTGLDQGVAAPQAQESDIWKIRGRIIYFFNRLRGLQIIDTADPANPSVTSLEIAAAGEDMYLLGGDESEAERALLITAVPWSPEAAETTRIRHLSVVAKQPSPLGSIDLPGSYVESRKIGNFLHVVTTGWSLEPQGWQSKTYLSSIDLTNGNFAVSKQQSIDLAVQEVGATANYFWVSFYQSGEHMKYGLLAYPIGGDGALGDSRQTSLGGAVLDKFKVGDTSDGLAVVVQNWKQWEQSTSVETYKDDGSALSLSGSVELIRGESLFATRFDQDRCYVVTFRQTDPLWIVDLSDTAKPIVRGHLEVPGWSTYIQPLGDILIAVGRDGSKVQVSMFDVSNPDQPTLVQRLDLSSSWSWSEAEWNEKAVKILPDSNLILIPVAETNLGTVTQRVSLVDFDVEARSLTARGMIPHDFSPRRADLLDEDMIASISNRELILVDATNRDAPQVVTDRTLAFGVDRLVVHDEVAIMFENAQGSWSYDSRKAIMRTALTNDVNSVIEEIELPCSSVSAAGVFGDRLVVVESGQDSRYGMVLRSPGGSQTGSSLSVWSLNDAEKPVLIDRADLPFEWGSEVQILPVDGGRVAIASRSGDWGCWFRPLPIMSLRNSSISASMAMIQPRFSFGRQSLQVAIADIASASPSVMGSWDFEGDSYSAISKVFASGELLAFSFEHHEDVQLRNTNVLRDKGWSATSLRTWLQILDLADPSQPMPWARVQIPGSLVSMADWTRAGATAFTRSGDRIAALGFNGETAPVIAEAHAGDTHLMAGSTLYTADQDGIARRDFSSSTGSWDLPTTWSLDRASSIRSLYEVGGGLAAVSHNQAWILGEDDLFSGYDILPDADFSAAWKSGDQWLVPSGEYGPLLLAPLSR